MRLIFLYGPPASGKLTIARELSKLTGFPVFHNHATVDLVLSLFEFGSPSFVLLRDTIWIEAMSEAARAGLPGLIFTFAPERTVPRDFVDRLVTAARSAGGEVLFVELQCPDNVVEQRLDNPSRAEFHKLRSVETYRELTQAGVFDFPNPPDPALSIDTAKAEPAEAARRIADQFQLRRS